MTRVAGVTGEIVWVTGECRSRPRQTIPRPIGDDAHAVQIVLLVGFALWVAVGGLTLPLLSSSLFVIFLLLLLLAAVGCIPGKRKKNYRKCRLFSIKFKEVAGLPIWRHMYIKWLVHEIELNFLTEMYTVVLGLTKNLCWLFNFEDGPMKKYCNSHFLFTEALE